MFVFTKGEKYCKMISEKKMQECIDEASEWKLLDEMHYRKCEWRKGETMYQDNVRQGLYDPSLEHDNCGIGAVVNIKGLKSHETVSNALKIVENLEHRAGKDAEGKTGDGVGILVQISHKFFEKACNTLGIFIGK